MDTTKTDKRKPRIENAPGLTWDVPKSGGLIARWKAATPIRERGFKPASARIWSGEKPTPTECLYIAAQCQRLQSEMHVWNRGGLPPPQEDSFDTLAELIKLYRDDPHSRYHKLRHRTRQVYDSRLRIIARDHGSEWVGNIKGRQLLRWYEEWVGEDNHIPRAYYLMAMLRSLFSFGVGVLEDERCGRLKAILSEHRYQEGEGAREERITAEQATAIRAMAHQRGMPSMALAQAFQFELALRQKDVIGEWAPLTEKGASDVLYGQSKWLYGLRWSEIDQNMVLCHVTSKKGKRIDVNLKTAPMVMEELKRLGKLPIAGPVIVNERTGRPWNDQTFRDRWRQVADACGIPKDVWNMDSRAGAITEATEAGAPIDHARAMATHSRETQTVKYTRKDKDKVDNVMRFRADHRQKKLANITETD